MRIVKLGVVGLLLCSFAAISGCKHVVIRDQNVYANEIGFWRASSDQSARALIDMITAHCTCEEDGWATQECDNAATLAITLVSRADYHADMMEYLGEIRDERPPANPPEVPPNTQLCPAE
jgi:hypothetical protein